MLSSREFDLSLRPFGAGATARWRVKDREFFPLEVCRTRGEVLHGWVFAHFAGSEIPDFAGSEKKKKERRKKEEDEEEEEEEEEEDEDLERYYDDCTGRLQD